MIPLSSNALILLAVLLIAYLLALLGLSLYARSRIQTEDDYLVAGRRLPLFLAWGTLLATWFGAASMVGSAEAARDEGLLGTVLDPFACSATLVLSGLFIARPLWRMRLLTMGDFYRRKYGPRAEVLSCCIQIPSYFGWIAAQYVALAGIQSIYFGIPEHYGILIAAAITLTYTMIGGMWSVTLTDTAQIVVALIGLLLLGEATFAQFGGGSVFDGLDRMLAATPADALTLLPPATLAAYLGWSSTWATGLFGNLPGQDLQQRTFAAKSENVAMQACLLAGLVYFVFGMIPVGLGLLSRLTDPQDVHGKILPLLAGKYLTPHMAIAFVLAMVSIIVSTATSAVLAPAAMLGHNLFNRIPAFRKRALLTDQLSVVLITAGGLVLAQWGKSIMELLEVSLDIALVALFIPLIMGLYGKPRSELPAVLSMSFGFTVWLVRFLAEEVVLPLPEAFANSGVGWHEWIARSLSSGDVIEAGAIVISNLAVVPPGLLGLSAGVAGFWLGQSFSAPKRTWQEK